MIEAGRLLVKKLKPRTKYGVREIKREAFQLTYRDSSIPYSIVLMKFKVFPV